MEKPTFPLPPRKYLVTGDRKVTTVLTILAKDKDGNQRWELADGATLYDVTHLGCRSARYTPATAKNSCSPGNVRTTPDPLWWWGWIHRKTRQPPLESPGRRFTLSVRASNALASADGQDVGDGPLSGRRGHAPHTALGEITTRDITAV
jgi:hypothetical protein